jgi:hypothetical protein
MSKAIPLSEKFEMYVQRRGDDECWGWLGFKSGDGYGKMRTRGKAVRAHRVSYQLHVGPIPDGLSVLHHCDNPGCVNPRHLFVGTHNDNMADCSAKGRIRWGDRRGSGNSNAKLNEDAVREIRRRAADGESRASIAAAFGLHVGSINNVVTRCRWGHVTDSRVGEPTG